MSCLLRLLHLCGYLSWLRSKNIMYAENYHGGWCKISSWCFIEKFWDVSWVIVALINDALVLSSSFSSCKFGWIKRDDNVVAHMLAKYASQSKLVVCNNEHIPQLVRDASLNDVILSFVLLMKLAIYKKYKKIVLTYLNILLLIIVTHYGCNLKWFKNK